MTTLERWGWTAREAALFQPHSLQSRSPGRVLAEHRGSYVVATERGEVKAAVSGRFRYDVATAEDFPAVGDWVACTPTDAHTRSSSKKCETRPAAGSQRTCRTCRSASQSLTPVAPASAARNAQVNAFPMA